MKNKGTKNDLGKIRADLLSPLALEELSKVLTFGASKYDSWNWSKGIEYNRILAAMLRHTFAYMAGEDLDPESGLNHIAHVMCNSMFLLHFTKVKPSLDNREKRAYIVEKSRSKNVLKQKRSNS